MNDSHEHSRNSGAAPGGHRDDGDPVRPHVFDGIQEYDRRLPNWWLLTLYGTILFSIVFWFVHFESKLVPGDEQQVTQEMSRLEAKRLRALVSLLDDDNLRRMAGNAEFVREGELLYRATCASCHAPSLRGRDEGPNFIGANLADDTWLHGSKPTQVFTTVKSGVPPKGMPAWGAMLGDDKVAQVTAYILSRHPAAGAAAAH